jgi:hypothetical protein
MAKIAFAPRGTTGMADRDDGYHFSLKSAGETCCMRWTPASYPLIFTRAKEVAVELVKRPELYHTTEDGPRRAISLSSEKIPSFTEKLAVTGAPAGGRQNVDGGERMATEQEGRNDQIAIAASTGRRVKLPGARALTTLI